MKPGYFFLFLPSTKPLVWWANVGSTQAGTCSTLQVFAALHLRQPEKIRKQEVINNMSDCNRTIEIYLHFSLGITERTGEIPHSSSGMFIFQLSFLDLSCSASHQPTCTGAPRPGLNKLEPPQPPMPFLPTLPYAHYPSAGSARKGVAPHAATASSRPSIVHLTVSLTPTFYPLLWIFKCQNRDGKYAAGALKVRWCK